ncbi:PadR family transcriptional regulator [Sphingomonas sp. 10B4]|nr:PadR family transcriptional regulator [Sphingomonas sp. 10B4]
MTSGINLPEGAWIVLGFLLDGAEPRSGYDLQAQAARSVAHFWPLTKAHVYTALPRLEAGGYVISTHVEQTGVPDKRVYAPTKEGEAAFRTWLTDTDLGMAKLRHPTLVKTFFGNNLSHDDFSALLDRHEARCLGGIERYTALIQSAEASPAAQEARFRLLAIRHGTLSLEADLKWIAEARKAVGGSFSLSD